MPKSNTNTAYYYNSLYKSLCRQFGKDFADYEVRKRLEKRLKRKGQKMLHDIKCAIHPSHRMEYLENGKLGAGYYCTKCQHYELDKDTLQDQAFIDDQLNRRL